MLYLITSFVITIVSICLGVTIGYRLRGNESPLPSIAEVNGILPKLVDDMPGPISPSDEARKNKKEKIKGR